MYLLVLLFACTPAEPAVEPKSTVAVPPVQPVPEPRRPKPDIVQTNAGPLTIRPIGHGSLAFEFAGKVWVVDPSSKPGGDYAGIKADIVLLTDIHPDHMDKAQLAAVSRSDTVVIAPAAVQKELGADVDVVIGNGETRDVGGVRVEAIPMYNLVRGPEPGRLFHDKGRGNGYVVTFGDKRVYLSGDTECTPDMKALVDIDVAFVCMNLPYTMPPEEAAACVAEFDPKVLYPYHYGESDLTKLSAGLEAETIELRLRDWYMTR